MLYYSPHHKLIGGCYVTVKRITFESKHYNHSETEQNIKAYWGDTALAEIPQIQSTITKPHYSIPMPPPNITGQLHLGHAIFLSIQDTIIRFYAQRGTTTHWIPGLDHAGLATHEKIMEKLASDNTQSYMECGETLAALNRGTIIRQFKEIGIACDWSEIKYTLDDQFKELTLDAFFKLDAAGKITRKDGSYFLNLDEEATDLAAAIESGEIQISSESHKKRLLQMLYHHQEWDIARSIEWGIKIPGENSLTFDTWFTSSLWAIATDRTGEGHDLMETGYDILYFWAARMLMMGKFLTGKYTFKYILLHGLLRDKNNVKFSKSLGNGINPLDLMDSHGADAIRIYCTSGIEMGMDSKFNLEIMNQGKKNLQKIYSCARLLDQYPEGQVSRELLDNSDLELQEQFEGLMQEVRLKEAMNLLLNEFKIEFCNEWIQTNKPAFGDLNMLNKARSKFQHRMLLLHPFIPHITTALL